MIPLLPTDVVYVRNSLEDILDLDLLAKCRTPTDGTARVLRWHWWSWAIIRVPARVAAWQWN